MVTLSKVGTEATMDVMGLAYPPVTRTVRRPWYPLVGHRDGLRRNDMITLASALFILALEGGTAYMSTDLVVNQGCN
jgi:hypothetical protein